MTAVMWLGAAGLTLAAAVQFVVAAAAALAVAVALCQGAAR